MIEPLESRRLFSIHMLPGDANLDGRVDGSDYTLIDNGFNNHLSGWNNGDFNADGKIDGSDYTLIDNAFNTQAAPPQTQYNGAGTNFNALAFDSASLDANGQPVWTLNANAITAPVSGYILTGNLVATAQGMPSPVTQITSADGSPITITPPAPQETIAVAFTNPVDGELAFSAQTVDGYVASTIWVPEGTDEIAISHLGGVESLSIDDPLIGIIDVGSQFNIVQN